VGRNTFTASVSEQSYVYPALMEWLDARVSGNTYKFISKFEGVKRFYDSEASTEVTIGGYPVSVHIETKDGAKSEDDDGFSSYMPQTSLIFTVRDAKALDAIQGLLNELTETQKQGQRKVSMYNITNYGWMQSRMPVRNLESVFLPEGVKEHLLNDLNTFIESEDRYVHVGIPWHRGYMLHGDPGNGKSSLVSAVANHFKLNLYNLPLSNIASDRQLADKISDIQENSIVLIEDIDIFASATTRNSDQEKGPTLAGLLNALDGVATPHGLITFITTNHAQKLDEALTRPGRIDYRLELLPPDTYQVESMFKHVYDEDLGVDHREFKSMAELTNVFKTHPNSHEAARLEIKET
jgi:chaperone BCS1